MIGTPRTGTSILYYTIAQHRDLWYLPRGSHPILGPHLEPDTEAGESDRTTAEVIDDIPVREVREGFYESAVNLDRILPTPEAVMTANSLPGRVLRKALLPILGSLSSIRKPSPIRLVEKNPKNSLRVSLLSALFPDARFIFNHRNPVDTIDSLVTGWLAEDRLGPLTRNRFGQTTPPVAGGLDIDGYDRREWCFALVPGWQELHGSSLGEVAAWQYLQCTRIAFQDLQELGSERVFVSPHERFLEDPVGHTREIFEWAGLPVDEDTLDFARNPPRVNQANPGEREENLRHEEAVRTGIGRVEDIQALAKELGYRVDTSSLQAEHERTVEL